MRKANLDSTVLLWIQNLNDQVRCDATVLVAGKEDDLVVADPLGVEDAVQSHFDVGPSGRGGLVRNGIGMDSEAVRGWSKRSNEVTVRVGPCITRQDLRSQATG